MDRREFVTWAGLGSISMFAPRIQLWGAMDDSQSESKASAQPRVLVLVELNGGNDGLNTVVPYSDDKYYELRPRLGVKPDKVIRLNDELGLHPALKPLEKAWEAHDMGIVNGVGYDAPNRSHFRSIEIWETGSDSDEVLSRGWLARLFAQQRPGKELAADSIVLKGDAGPCYGPDMRNVALTTPEQFTRRAKRLGGSEGETANPALDHILGVRSDLQKAARAIEERYEKVQKFGGAFPKTAIGRQLQVAAEVICGHIPVGAIKVAHGSFDTHTGQLGRHERLLKDLAEGLAAFRAALRERGEWDRVLLMTYSEFGRRPRENGNQGTDHGTAAPHFVMGGRVNGGMYGKQPSLEKLANADLVHTVDYRSLYRTVARDWWNLAGFKELSQYPSVPFLRVKV